MSTTLHDARPPAGHAARVGPAVGPDGASSGASRGSLADAALAALRVVTGLLFMQHGAQKLFGLLLPPERTFDGAPALLSQIGIAGWLELVGGALVALGLLTRPVAFLLAGLMAVAYFLAHASRGFWPILNAGEPAILYCFVFLLFAALGAGRFSLDALLTRRRR